MTRILHFSDIHREMYDTGLPLPTADCPAGSVDAIVVNGDLNARGRHIVDACALQDAWQAPVILVRGNHERYCSDWQDFAIDEAARLDMARELGRDIRLLDCETTVIGDTRILGCTLWTDFAIVGDPAMTKMGARIMVNDYRKIGWRGEDGHVDNLEPDQTAAIHAKEKAWLMQELAKPFEGRTLVVTHHLPAPELLAREARKSDFAPVYVSDLRQDFLGLKIDAWMTGHTHWARRGTIEGLHGPIAFTANMPGYFDQRTNYEPHRILDMDEPTRGLEPIGIVDPALAHLEDAAAVLHRLKASECPTP
ncbi:metallophosphoesterase [Cereibacter sphaeroides]|uniref:metallophosphoesterase n=1 Tax=Cereibacter sphaeroides TaxID=1063 RepID=UPI001F1B5E3F|nr:metallophosphoesterase [Cereibacter sphaeroides]MCE6957735.1 metallophosphoesterase [Cereibacter sphaeroides]MCE6971521.1 metallophosphoesterase [Cereibacter sphaeroides]